jgi:hypothetical protein
MFSPCFFLLKPLKANLGSTTSRGSQHNQAEDFLPKTVIHIVRATDKKEAAPERAAPVNRWQG